MYVSLNWLKQYVPDEIQATDEELRERISIAFAEVEDIRRTGDQLKDVVVGQIKSIDPHTKSDKLQIVTVDSGGKRTRKVVCAAKNIFVGAKVPVVTPGGVVLNPKEDIAEQQPITIKEAEVAGEISQGMLCSQKELGIGDDHQGIWILPEELEIGTDLVPMIRDTIFEIENKSLTNRPDCFCHVGIARELGAIFKKTFKGKEVGEALIPTEKMKLEVKIDNKELCKRYSAIVIKGITIGPSPLWLQLKLLSVGMRPINNVVDATNYVMMDMGQPMHAFDYHKVKSNKIVVRNAKSGEKVTTLTHEEKELKNNHLVIADAQDPIALAGIIGGENSDIDDKTKDIVVESANFEMYNLRRSTRELGQRTEASLRFEKGLDPNITIEGLKQVTRLITEIAGGEVASEIVDVYPEPVKEKELDFDTFDVSRLLGIEVSRNEVVEIFKSLSIEIISPESSGNQLKLRIPTFRRDLNIKEDLIEEVARIFGYDKFQPTLPTKTIKAGRRNKEREFDRKVRLTLASLGFDELYTYAFTNEEFYNRSKLDIKKCIRIKNPLSSELSHLRTRIIPSLLDKVNFNLSYFDEINVFELARIYLKEKNEEGLPKQPKKVALLRTKGVSNEDLFLELKGYIEELQELLDIVDDLRFEKSDVVPFLDANYQAKIFLGKTYLGYIGCVSDDVKDNWDISKNTVVAEIDFETVYKRQVKKKEYKPVSVFPHVKRDFSFWIDTNVTVETILKALRNAGTSHLRDLETIDVYKDTKNKKRKSIAITATLQSQTETLSEEQITTDVNHLLSAIEKLGGTLRK